VIRCPLQRREIHICRSTLLCSHVVQILGQSAAMKEAHTIVVRLADVHEIPRFDSGRYAASPSGVAPIQSSAVDRDRKRTRRPSEHAPQVYEHAVRIRRVHSTMRVPTAYRCEQSTETVAHGK
jgi:hypothetical protein